MRETRWGDSIKFMLSMVLMEGERGEQGGYGVNGGQERRERWMN